MRLLLPLVLLVLACGSNEGAPDAGATDAGNATPDAGESPEDAGEAPEDAGEAPEDAGEPPADAGDVDPCETPCNAPDGPDECVCLANVHCGAAFRCSHDLECVCGARGTGTFETPCTTNDDCERGVCAEYAPNQGYCSKTCTGLSCDGTRLTVCEPFLEDLALCWYED